MDRRYNVAVARAALNSKRPLVPLPAQEYHGFAENFTFD